jgi:membrane-bound lytic murein transglycosylase D
MTPRAALLALLLLAPSAALAQTADTARADSAPQPAARPSRWATPFSVQSTGRPTPHRVQGEVVWAAAERPARRAAEPADSAAAETTADTASADSAPPRRRTTRADTATTRRANARRDTAAARTTARRDTATARPPATRPRTHRVADGETLAGIARRYGVTTAQLRVLNPNDTAGALEAGMVLRLPPAPRPAGSAPAATTPRPAGGTPAATTTRTPAERPAARRRTHTVAPRETLFSLARRYGVTTDAIRRANDLPSDQLRAGQTLVIP